MTTATMLIVTDAKGVGYGALGGAAEAEAAMKAGYIKVTPTVFVSTAGARIEVVTGTIAPAPPA